ncbi:bifunctional proline dehydrogenase/L-glutamate gamma-semialdehyde dehydrogenase [Bacteroides sp. 519]|uniref:bifunctional proline dehydrogenase/L-glutamate gamma-semialdehyde dehydrogenase n=1 Tax=Bacteroides sp. 519 TaxID=2302937 RepID=UPI0013D63A88|nr:bifunctional proline dehydrogenase/L-glutamate gamma-semialdehyde dehydrogenase [Bacteroides sp. 519]NDV59576.1 aldehyde dehydrogenase family protein [Bacteroides sp. 519]
MKNVTSSEVLLWAQDFLAKAEKQLSPAEIKEQKMFASLVTDPKNKVILTKLLDESSQIRDTKTLSERMKVIFTEYGVPAFMGKTYEYLGILFKEFGYLFDFIAVPIFKNVLRKETGKIIIKEERPALTKHLNNRWKDNIGQNVNLLGEVVLGDGEAQKRYEHYLEALSEPDINYISVKLSGIYAQLHPLSYDKSKEDLCKLMTNIYQQAINHPYTDHAGIQTPKFVNLDMEEYKDAELTLDVFTTVMALPQFKNYTAGIVVQAYLPDAIFFYQTLLDFAKKRVANGGAPIKVRLVKGANLQMETIQSSLKGWPNPILPSKVDVDANYMRILDIALQPENAKVVHMGVASHNFFTIGYAYLLSKANAVEEYVTFEMLEGMANHLPRAMRELGKQVILYTPVVKKEHFLNAVSYLVRRLDENTGIDNFLTYSFNLTLHSKEWEFLSNQFAEAYAQKDNVKPTKFRTQNRTQQPEPVADINVFRNEPDTDLDLKPNRMWALEALKKWETEVRDTNFIIPVQIGNKEVITEKKKKYYDRSRNDEVCFCEVNMATQEQIEEIVQIAEKDDSGWRKTSLENRNKILHKTAEVIGERRGDLIACMSAITGKTFMEGDIEVSEGTDFCRFYPISMQAFEQLESVTYAPKGIILVIPPWNFPFAIPVGGVVAGLAGGNTVILKPATVAFPIAWQFAQCFWDAGVPKDALQVICPADRSSLNWLSAHPSIKHIILTGGTDTAFKLQKNSPKTPLSAETGGKNAIIVTASADQDHAILNIVSSAFSNAGQKCSACSLLLLDKKAYNDPVFQSKLKDAVTSMHTGNVWNTDNIIGPMITNDNDKLLHAIEHLEEGEFWLVPPVFLDEKKYILKPCVKWGVKPGNYTFRTELFAPLLSVVCIDDLEQGLEYANSTEYGLTSGLQSLDEREIALWKDKIEAGNLYINRGITGAIVRRQPFGGMKRSAFGAGIKAGGPNYVSCFVKFTEKEIQEMPEKALYPFKEELKDILSPQEINRLKYAFGTFEKAWKEEFSVERDVSHIVGELNTFRYLPLKLVAFYVKDTDNLTDVILSLYAAGKTKTKVLLAISPTNPHIEILKAIAKKTNNFELGLYNDEDFIEDMVKFDRIRTCSADIPDAIFDKAAELGMYIATEKPVAEGRIEILHYLKEQSISYEYHRYGSIIEEPKI